MKKGNIILRTQYYEKKYELIAFMNQFNHTIMCPKSYTIEQHYGLYRAVIVLKMEKHD